MSGLILALDTATEVSAVGIGAVSTAGALEVIATCDVEAPRAAMSRLLPCVAELLDGLGASAQDIGEVVVGRGPGSFTGVRIGVATAKGIAQGLGARLHGVSTPEAVAQRFTHEPELLPESGLLGVVGDAMRGEVYPALFRVLPSGVTRLDTDHVTSPQLAAEKWAAELDGSLLLAGNGLAKHAAAFRDVLAERAIFAPEGLGHPSGEGLLRAYAAALAAGSLGYGDPATLLPVYTRLSDAEEADRARRGLPQIDPPAAGVTSPPDGGSPR